jgi:site-specific DNA-cytosine methylase
MKVFIDLCSGLGGASEAFLQHSEWNIIRIDNSDLDGICEDTPYTFDYDVKEWMDWIWHIEEMIAYADTVVVWASPPCLEFSQGFSSPASIANREGREFNPDMSIFESCLAIIEHLQPDFWIVENVRGALPHFQPIIGKFKQQIHSFYLWGNYPYIDVDPYRVHTKASVDTTSSNPLRANIKGKVPFHVSQSLLEAVEGHTDLRQWM